MRKFETALGRERDELIVPSRRVWWLTYRERGRCALSFGGVA